eukprot:gene16795-19952_t
MGDREFEIRSSTDDGAFLLDSISDLDLPYSKASLRLSQDDERRSDEHDFDYELARSKIEMKIATSTVQYEQMTRAAVERTMEKYRTDLLRVLENMNGRLVGLEKSCEQLALSVGELHTETTTQRENTDERLKALDLVSKEVARKVNILKDKMEVAETQKELEKASLETDTSTE